MARTAVSCPAQSNGTLRRGDRPVQATKTSATAPTGTLMAKISRQVTTLNRPPSTGPDVDATAPPMAHTPTARTRLAGSAYAWRMRAIEDGISTAAAAPWTNRAATRAPSVGANPQAAEAAANTASPAAKARRAPIRSDSAPAVCSRAAKASV
jgi:hypothetical protein